MGCHPTVHFSSNTYLHFREFLKRSFPLQTLHISWGLGFSTTTGIECRLWEVTIALNRGESQEDLKSSMGTRVATSHPTALYVLPPPMALFQEFLTLEIS